MIGSKGQKLCRNCARLPTKNAPSCTRALCVCVCVSACVHVCVCVCAAQIGRQAVLTRMWIVCAQRCDTRQERSSANNVLFGAGTISALCGRTAALPLNSQASRKLLFYWQTKQPYWQTSATNVIFMDIDAPCKSFLPHTASPAQNIVSREDEN